MCMPAHMLCKYLCLSISVTFNIVCEISTNLNSFSFLRHIYNGVSFYFFQVTFRKKLVNFSYHWYSKPSLNYPFSTVWIFPVLLTLNYFCTDTYSNFPNYLLRNFTNILFIYVTLYLILSQCFLCLFLCSFPINTVAFYHLEFCPFHYVLWGEGGKTDQNMVYILYLFSGALPFHLEPLLCFQRTGAINMPWIPLQTLWDKTRLQSYWVKFLLLLSFQRLCEFIGPVWALSSHPWWCFLSQKKSCPTSSPAIISGLVSLAQGLNESKKKKKSLLWLLGRALNLLWKWCQFSENVGQAETQWEGWKFFKCLSFSFPGITPSVWINSHFSKSEKKKNPNSPCISLWT